MSTKSIQGIRPRWFRWSIRIVLVLAILICVAAGLLWFYFDRTAAEGRKKLAEAIAETDALDPRWKWEQIQEDLPAIPDSENSMRVISHVINLLDEWNPSLLVSDSGNNVLDDLEDWPANRQLDEQRLALICEALKNHEPALRMAESIKDYPRGQTVIDLSPLFLDTSLKHAQDCRTAVSLLELDIERLLHERRPKEAAFRIHAILQAGTGLRQDPFLVSQLCRMSARSHAVLTIERLLGMTEDPTDELEGLMTRVRAELDEKLLLIAIRGERAGWHLHMENLESGRVRLEDFLALGEGNKKNEFDILQRFGTFLYQPRLYEDHAFMLQEYNRTLEIAQLPDSEQGTAWYQWINEFRATTSDTFSERRLILSKLMFPAVQKCAYALLQNKAKLSCILVALAAERFRLAQKRWPKNLQELCPAYLKEVPVNPSDGKPLMYRLRKDGILICSVDIGGYDDDEEDVPKHTVDEDKPKGLGVRVWNPDHRRLPAKPKNMSKSRDPDDP
jgi:hypothetical protein